MRVSVSFEKTKNITVISVILNLTMKSKVRGVILNLVLIISTSIRKFEGKSLS